MSSDSSSLRQVSEQFVRVGSPATVCGYFGYLRCRFWLNKLNQFDGNFEQAEMVKAFIRSGEYRRRFGQ